MSLAVGKSLGADDNARHDYGVRTHGCGLTHDYARRMRDVNAGVKTRARVDVGASLSTFKSQCRTLATGQPREPALNARFDIRYSLTATERRRPLLLSTGDPLRILVSLRSGEPLPESQRDEACVTHKIALPHPTGFLHQAVEPLKSRPLHPDGGT